MAEQYGFFVDSTRCVKCWACEVGCQQWHGIKAGTVHRRKVSEECTGTFPEVKRTFTSMSCMHCENPACVAGCPVGAITKREEDGVVVVNKAVCIGCKTCSTVCPFGVPEYLELEGGALVMDKCDGCVTLGREGDEAPRCVNTCPTKALHFGPLAEMEALAAAKGGYRLDGETLPSVFVAYR